MALEGISNTNKLAVLSNMAYSCLKENESKGTSKDRIKASLEIAKGEFKNIGIDKLEYHSSNQDMFAVVDNSAKKLFVVYKGANAPGKGDLFHFSVPRVSRLMAATIFAQDAASKCQGYEVTTTGHSLGGIIAELVAHFSNYICESFYAGASNDPRKEVDLVNSFSSPNESFRAHHINWDPTSAGFHLEDKIYLPGSNELSARSMENFIRKVKDYNEKANPNPGGVDLTVPEIMNNEAFKWIKGVSFNGGRSYFQTKDNEIGINIGLFATALLIHYDPLIKCKILKFSLEPEDLKNPEGDYQLKKVWPDIVEGKDIIGNTFLGNIMYEADFLMKQMSLGIAVNRITGKQTPFAYPPELVSHGFGPSKFSNVQGSNCCRFWLEVKKIKACETDNSFSVEQITMCVKAKLMMINSSNELIDLEVQDVNDESYKFADKFTKLYDVIAQEYPIFEELKQVALANAIASWCWKKGIPMNIEKLQAIKKTQIIQNWEKRSPTIKGTQKTTTQSGKTVTTHIRSVVGGVNMPSLFDFKTNSTTGEQESCFSDKVFLIKQAMNSCKKVCNPLDIKCSCCHSNVEIDIIKKEKINDNYYCLQHHPLKCGRCNELVDGQNIKMNDVSYHKNCFLCLACPEPINDEHLDWQEYIIHPHCKEQLIKKLQAWEELRKNLHTVSKPAHQEEGSSERNLNSKKRPFGKKQEEEMKRILNGEEEKKEKAKKFKENDNENESLNHLKRKFPNLTEDILISLNHLKEMFPNYSEDNLIIVLNENKGDVNSAIDFLKP